MIVIYHSQNSIISIVDHENNQRITVSDDLNIAGRLLDLAVAFPDRLLLWCDQYYREQLNTEQLTKLFGHKKILLSYGVENFIPDAIGYVDESLFCNPNRTVSYPTWQMQTSVGGVYAETVLALKSQLKTDRNFAYFLCSLAKLAMPLGLLCRSEPLLLKTPENIKPMPDSKVSYTMLFRFVKQHYRLRWLFLLTLNLWLYERKVWLLPLIKALFYKQRFLNGKVLDTISEPVRKMNRFEIDVVIPTIGRKMYLYDVLLDLSAQTILPKKVIIVEQNPDANSTSELDFLSSESWPFAIVHRFIHQTGACNARNIALPFANSEWVFLADDDIRFESDFLEKASAEIEKSGEKVFTVSCLRKGDQPKYQNRFQWGTFGSGCSIVNREALQGLEFDMRFENGFGEDADFGMKLRHKGYDIFYLPQPEMVHLKAPVGGFRTRPVLEWQHEKIQPKPSPTVMLYRMLHHTVQQVSGYKTTLFIKFYSEQPDKNPLSYYRKFQKAWELSKHWATILKNRS